MSKRPAYHHGDLRLALISAATAIAQKHGAEGITLRAVAKKAGVSEAAPYHHFKDKTELLAQVAGNGFEALHVAFEAAGAGKGLTARERLLRLGEAYVRFAIEHRAWFRLMFGAHVVDLELVRYDDVRRHGHAARGVIEAAIADFLRQTRSRFSPLRLFRIYWAQVHGTAWLVVERELGRDFTEEDGLALVRQGVTALLA